MQSFTKVDDHTRSARGDQRASVSTRRLFAACLCGVLIAASPAAWADDIGGEPIVVPPSSRSAPPSAPADRAQTSQVPSRALADAATYRSNDLDDWKFLVSLYGWFTWLDGEINIRNTSAPVGVSFDNIWKQLHMALFAEVEAQKGDVGFFSDLTYARLWNRQQRNVLNVKTDMNLVLFDFGFYYEALKLDLGKGKLPPRLRLQPFVGGRYMYMGIDAQLRPSSVVLNPRLNSAAPVIGLRGFLDIDEHWNLSFVGDGGGFGVDEMEKTWQAELLAGYRFRFQSWDLNLQAGYKAVGVEIASGEKPIDGDLVFHGPVAKLAFEF